MEQMQEMLSLESQLVDSFSIVELEERLEMTAVAQAEADRCTIDIEELDL